MGCGMPEQLTRILREVRLSTGELSYETRQTQPMQSAGRDANGVRFDSIIPRSWSACIHEHSILLDHLQLVRGISPLLQVLVAFAAHEVNGVKSPPAGEGRLNHLRYSVPISKDDEISLIDTYLEMDAERRNIVAN